MKKILLIIFLAALIPSLNAAIKNVPSQYSTIQAAINAAVYGDTVLVQPGTYFENIHLKGKNIIVTSTFYQTQNVSIISSTIINGSTPANTDSASCVRIVSNNDDSIAVLQGFTLTGGTGTLWQDEHGAGRYCEGGGILMQYTKATVQFNIIRDNKAIRRPAGISSTGGGGIRMGDGRAKILNNIIFNNEGMYGGGVVLNYSNSVLKNCVIFNNKVYQAVAGAPTYGGGGVWTNGNTTNVCVIENNTIINNSSFGGGGSAAGQGGGILVYQVPTTILNNIVWGNTANVSSAGLKQISDIFSGTATVTYSCVQNGFAGTGNDTLNPQFDSTNYLLSASSPCIDKGNPAANYNDPQGSTPGLALFPAKGTTRNDMGAYGGPLSKLIAASVVGIHNLATAPANFELKQNYPNPFNPSTLINFEIPRAGFVSLKIYNSLGKEIAVILNEVKNEGAYAVNFDAGKYALTSGVYFYTLNYADRVQTRAMILIK
ncbi:MAG: T9SS type A sorting domain-containing protein [Ignavibacteria bacterium]|nr:T9SS type A sorting domain-containing protein [Ignavibacteria bacterium]